MVLALFIGLQNMSYGMAVSHTPSFGLQIISTAALPMNVDYELVRSLTEGDRASVYF